VVLRHVRVPGSKRFLAIYQARLPEWALCADQRYRAFVV
jgi:hypothetical protein